jgi:hypothetical protein
MSRSKHLLLLLCSLFTGIVSFSQDLKLSYHPDSYRINLPPGLMKKPVINAISEIVPKTVTELSNRQFCTDGKADYYMLLAIDSFRNDQYYYHFDAVLRVFDSTGTHVVDIRLVSLDETFKYKADDLVAHEYPKIEYENVYDRFGKLIAKKANPTNLTQPSTTNYNEVDIIGICEAKIYRINKLLEKQDQ